MRFFFLSIPNEMQNTIRELYYTERKGTYDPHGWDKLSLCLTDRYNAGVLDNPPWSNIETALLCSVIRVFRGLQVSNMRISLALRFSGNCMQTFSRRALGVLLFKSRVLTLFFN